MAGQLRFGIEEVDKLLRVVADFVFSKALELDINGEPVQFTAGRSLRLFFSYRHTKRTLARSLAKHGFSIAASQVDSSSEEGVFRAVQV